MSIPETKVKEEPEHGDIDDWIKYLSDSPGQDVLVSRKQMGMILTLIERKLWENERELTRLDEDKAPKYPDAFGG